MRKKVIYVALSGEVVALFYVVFKAHVQSWSWHLPERTHEVGHGMFMKTKKYKSNSWIFGIRIILGQLEFI
jgi:hypothetical protein